MPHEHFFLAYLHCARVLLVTLEMFLGASCPATAHADVEKLALLLHDERDRHR